MSTKWNYAFEGYDKENMARAAGVYIDASFKYLREVGKFIRGKNLIRAISELEDITKMKRALPLGRYNKDVPHKKAIGPGRYPINTVKSVIDVLKNALANTREKGLNETNVVIIHASSSKAIAKGRRRGKLANFEVVVAEAEEKKNKKEAKAEKKEVKKKEEPKKEEKKEEVKHEEKKEAKPKPAKKKEVIGDKE